MKVAIQLLLLVKFSMLSLRINFPVPLLWLILLNQTEEADSFNSSTDQPYLPTSKLNQYLIINSN